MPLRKPSPPSSDYKYTSPSSLPIHNKKKIKKIIIIVVTIAITIMLLSLFYFINSAESPTISVSQVPDETINTSNVTPSDNDDENSTNISNNQEDDRLEEQDDDITSATNQTSGLNLSFDSSTKTVSINAAYEYAIVKHSDDCYSDDYQTMNNNQRTIAVTQNNIDNNHTVCVRVLDERNGVISDFYTLGLDDVSQKEELQLENEEIEEGIQALYSGILSWSNRRNGEIPTQNDITADILTDLDLPHYGEIVSITPLPIEKPSAIMSISFAQYEMSRIPATELHYAPTINQIHIFTHAICNQDLNRNQPVSSFVKGAYYLNNGNNVLQSGNSRNYAFVYAYKGKKTVSCVDNH